MGGFISKAKAVPVEKKPEPEELEKPVSGDERKENEIQNPEGLAKVTEDPIAEEAGGDANHVMDELVGQAGKMSIEEEDAPRPVEPEPEKEVYTTCTNDEDKDNQAETAVDQSQVRIYCYKKQFVCNYQCRMRSKRRKRMKVAKVQSLRKYHWSISNRHTRPIWILRLAVSLWCTCLTSILRKVQKSRR